MPPKSYSLRRMTRSRRRQRRQALTIPKAVPAATKTRTFASYLGWETKNGANTKHLGQKEDSEKKEECDLPAEFDESTSNRYFDRKNRSSRRSASITEGVGFVSDQKREMKGKRVLVKARKPTNAMTDWRSIREVVITASTNLVDHETEKSAYSVLLREGGGGLDANDNVRSKGE